MYAHPTDSLSSAGHPITHRGATEPGRPQTLARRQRTSTRLAYERDVGRFIRRFGGTIPCSANDLVSYITQQIKRVAPATVLRRLMAIQDAHNRAGHPSPTADLRIREAMRWLDAGQAPANLLIKPGKNKNQVEPDTTLAPLAPPTLMKQRRKPSGAKPITRALLLRTFDAMGTGKRTKDLRDKAIILLGFSGLKRATICATNLEDLVFTEDVMHVHIGLRTSDSDDGMQAEPGRVIAIPITRGPLCAASAVKLWIEHNDLAGKSGALFPRFSRSGEPAFAERLDSGYVNSILKDRLKDAGIDDVSQYSAESLRKGHDLEAVKPSRR